MGKGNRKTLETLVVLGRGSIETEDKINNIVSDRLVNLDVDLLSNLKEIAKIYPKNSEDIYIYGRICWVLSIIFANQPEETKPYRKKISDKDYLESYKRFLRVQTNVKSYKDISELHVDGTTIAVLDGIRDVKINHLVGGDIETAWINEHKHILKAEYIKDNGNTWVVLRIDDKENNIGAIFMNEGKKAEIMPNNSVDDKIKILRRLAIEDFDYAITTYLGPIREGHCGIDGAINKICYDFYKKCGIDELENNKALNLISLLEYVSSGERSRCLRLTKKEEVDIGKVYLKFREIRNLSCDAILTLIDQYALLILNDTEENKVMLLKKMLNITKKINLRTEEEAEDICNFIGNSLEDKVDSLMEEVEEEDTPYEHFLDLLDSIITTKKVWNSYY